jgi:alpha-L-rhamnosidase
MKQPLLAFISVLLVHHAQAGELSPTRLLCDHLDSPLAVESRHPTLEWKLAAHSGNQHQTAYQIRVSSTLDKATHDRFDLWDTGKVAASRSTQIQYAGKPIKPMQSAFWQVRIWDSTDSPSEWSPLAHWKQAPIPADDWNPKWISASTQRPPHTDSKTLHLPPAIQFRKSFEIANTVRRATLYLSALGDASPSINGKPASEQYFLPGWSDYRQRAYYRALDVTPHLKPGPNVLGITLADGWYSGYVGYALLIGYGPNKVGRNLYGKDPAVMAQLFVEFEDGNRKMIATDASWRWSDDGPVREADLLMGEHYDARKSLGWDTPEFDAATWKQAALSESTPPSAATFHDTTGPRTVDLGFKKPAALESYAAPPVRAVETLEPKAITQPARGIYIFNFGTNFAGNVRLNIRGKVGQKITLRYGEMLHSDGSLMTENLRKARATDTYICSGAPEGEQWTPRFTYHGFQYVEVAGLDAEPQPSLLSGIVLQSDTPRTATFECSDPIINQLFRNIQRTQRANFLEIPTDCPQRDERLGWLGDAQIYIRSATFNADVSTFFNKWLTDLREAQRDTGAYPDYAPYPMSHGESGKPFGSGWMDAGVICPHTLWKVYGNVEIINRQWASMKRFMDFRESLSPNYKGVSVGNPWGDWLNQQDATPMEWIDAAYFAHSAQLMSEMAEATGRSNDAAHYRDVFNKVRSEFIRTVIARDGTVSGASQTACVLALDFGLHPKGGASVIAEQLVNLIAKNGDRMSTGFLGTRSLLPVLSKNGHHETALKLFQSRQFPSWCYPVTNGATSIWERWDSYTKDAGFGRQNTSMNSFSHYAFGAVCEWMFRDLAGIDFAEPGFTRIRLAPAPPSKSSTGSTPPLHFVKASYDSPVGIIGSEWKRDSDAITFRFQVPPNVEANLEIPEPDKNRVMVKQGNGTYIRSDAQRSHYRLPPGDHVIRVEEKATDPRP